MKALVCQHGELSVEEQPEPTPAKGHALLKVLRCGICGSDLHARHHCSHSSQLMRRTGFSGFMRQEESVVMGHEFCGEVLDYGPGSRKKLKPGIRVCALPMLKHGDAIDLIGFSARSNGAYAERMLVDELLMLPIPNGLSHVEAALTEPLAVGLHAVHRAEIKRKDVAIVIGCGPVGLAVIANLKAIGVQTVVASDFSPGRGKLAAQCGADIVIDPSEQSPYDNWEAFGFTMGIQQALGMGMDAREKMESMPVPWWHLWRLAEKLGAAAPKRPVIFECVGVPGLLNNVIDGAPLFSRIVVVGLCMESDKIEPSMAIQKEIDLRFVVGYSLLEYRDTLHRLADGKLNARPMITGAVGLYGVENAFSALGDPETHAKIMVDPKSQVIEPTEG